MGGKPFERDRTPAWIVGYALYLYLSGLSFRKDARAVGFFLPRSHESIWRWLHRFGGLSEAFNPGLAKTAVVDECSLNVKGLEAWMWMALDPGSRRLLALEVTWTRSNLTACGFLKELRERHGVRVIITDEAPWYRAPCPQLGLRHIVDPHAGNFMERLSKEVKRRLKDFDLYFPCRCPQPFNHVKTWLEAWKTYYNHARPHMSLGRAPCGSISPEPDTMLSLVKEVMQKA
jgi:transposase-like protein